MGTWYACWGVYAHLKALWGALLGFSAFDEHGFVGEMRNEFDLSGEVWNRRTVGDDFDICLSPAETANGLRRMNDIL